MRTRIAIILWCLLVLPETNAAQDRPLSVIDWLSPGGLTGVTGPVLIKPPYLPGAFAPSVEVTPLPPSQPALGLVPPEVTGLAADIWRRSDPDTLTYLLNDTPIVDNPSMQRLLFSLLIGDGISPTSDVHDQVLLARLDRLLELGAADSALALVKQAGPQTSPARFARWLDAALLLEREEAPCAALAETPHLSADLVVQTFCTARQGNWHSALLIAMTGAVLDRIGPADRKLLLRFLAPDGDDDTAPLPPPEIVTPIRFRLHEAIGEPLTTMTLPRFYANADLRDISGWKAQLHAAERLARSGAMNPNQLLGIYTKNDPPASGGIWDRVTAIQDFDFALKTENITGIAATLPKVWTAMQQARLEAPFAYLFARQLDGLRFDDPDLDRLAWHIRLLDSGYRETARTLPDDTIESVFLQSIAFDQMPIRSPTDPQAQAIVAGMTDQVDPTSETMSLLSQGHKGEALLRIIKEFDNGVKGDLNDLAGALTSLRAAELKDIASRAALEMRLLDRRI